MILQEQKEKPLILLLENDPSVNEVMCMILSEEGYRCNGYRDEKAFVESLAQSRPDLLIIEMGRYKENLTLCHQLRDSETLGHIPIILTTTKTVRELPAGKYCEAILEKPFDITVFTALITCILGDRKQRQTNL